MDIMYSTIYPKVSARNPTELLVEDTAVDRKRQELNSLRNELNIANTTIQKLL